MIFVASSCLIVIVTILVTSAAAPVPDYLHTLTNYDFTDFGKKSYRTSNETNRVTQSNESKKNNKDERSEEEPTMYVIEFESEPREKDMDNGSKENDSELDMEKHSPLDPWSIVWYIGSFGGLVAFFLIVSCSEWCCRRSARPLNTPYNPQRHGETVNSSRGVTETPPPPYHLFAPPPYDSVNYGDLMDKTSGEKMNIYVISVPLQGTAQPTPA